MSDLEFRPRPSGPFGDPDLTPTDLRPTGGLRLWVAAVAVVALAAVGAGTGYAAATIGRQVEDITPMLEQPDPFSNGGPPWEVDVNSFGEVGTCLTDETLLQVSCSEPHFAEVVAMVTSSASTYPGGRELQADMAERCHRAILQLPTADPEAPGFLVIAAQPSERAWIGGTRDAACVAFPFEEVISVGSLVEGTVAHAN